MQYKLVCSDIDGTLLNKDRELSVRTINAIKNLDSSIPVILVSSRMPKAMTHLQADLNIMSHPLIAYNGGLIIDYINGKSTCISSIEISTDLINNILTKVENTTIHVSLYHADEWYVPAMDQWALREQNNTKVSPEVADLKKICNDWKEKEIGAHKIMCMGPETEIKTLADYLTTHYHHELHVYKSKSTYLEIASRKISKLSALQYLIHHKYRMDIKDVIAFGDNYNDEEMIGGAGYGVAVANAREEVKAVAKRITLDHKDDGVAIVLEEVFGI